MQPRWLPSPHTGEKHFCAWLRMAALVYILMTLLNMNRLVLCMWLHVPRSLSRDLMSDMQLNQPNYFVPLRSAAPLCVLANMRSIVYVSYKIISWKLCLFLYISRGCMRDNSLQYPTSTYRRNHS